MSIEPTLGVKLAGKLQDALTRNGIEDLADIDWLASGDNIARVRSIRLGQAIALDGKKRLPKPARRKRSRYLKQIATATLAPTIGATTLSQAGDVFTGYVDPDLKNWDTNKAGVDTSQTAVVVYEMTKDGNYATLFRSLSSDICPLVMTQGQIKEFARSHRHLLRQDGYATFFLFEVEIDGQLVLFVAYVHVYAGRLYVGVDRFSDGDVWDAGYRHRLVVPQQTV